MEMIDMAEIVVEIRGGVLVEAYSLQDAQITVIDWDNYSRSESLSCVGTFPCMPVRSMPTETAAIVGRLKASSADNDNHV